MSKPDAKPEESSPESPAYWQKNFDASDKRRQRVNTQGARFARWQHGDMRDVVDPKQTEDFLRWQSGLENMFHLSTVASMADLLFRFPQFVQNTPYVSPQLQPELDEMGMPMPPQPPATLFNPALARCQTARLSYILKRVNYLNKARRSLQDTLLFGMGSLKITVDQELVVDDVVLAAAKEEAMEEVRQFLLNGMRLEAREDQIHSVHIELKRQLVAQAEKGRPALPKAAIRYLRKHIAIHEAMKGSERPSETIRNCQVRIRRINPLDRFWDPTVDDRDDASWQGTRFLMRKADVLGNEDWDEQARLELQEATDRWETKNFRPSVVSPGSFDVPEDMVMVNEAFDLVEQKRYLWADGGSLHLLPGEDRGELRDLQPSGPFNDLVFIEDAMESHGIPPGAAFEAEQAAATAIATANVGAAIQSIPRSMYNASDIDAGEAERIWKGDPNELIPVKPKGDPKKPLEDCFAQVPAPEIHEQTMVVLQNCIRGIERRSGLGVAKLGGGEQSPTATGAALGAEASMAISEDRGALIDAWQERTGRMIVRLDRRFTPKSQWIEVCGDEALEAVPDSFTLSESMDDIAVEIVPGSSRRRNTSVDQKQLLDGFTAIAADPMFAGPAGSRVKLQLIRRFFDDAGLTGIDWTPLEQEAQMLAMMQQAAGGPPDASGSPETDEEGSESGGGTKPRTGRSGESQGVAPNDINQGVQNPGAGRVSSGPSVSDKISKYRGAAVSAVNNRG